MTANFLDSLSKEHSIWVEIPYKFKTILGESDVHVQVNLNDLKEDASIVFKPNEEDRLMKEQSKKFLKKVLSNQFEISGTELRYLMRLYAINQATLARSLGLSDAAVSQYLKNENKISRQVQHNLCAYFLLESYGFGLFKVLSNLSKGKDDDGYFDKIEKRIA
jgi:DNA-binding transcriptional regulator YiaG